MTREDAAARTDATEAANAAVIHSTENAAAYSARHRAGAVGKSKCKDTDDKAQNDKRRSIDIKNEIIHNETFRDRLESAEAHPRSYGYTYKQKWN